jgi:hypothetical protein
VVSEENWTTYHGKVRGRHYVVIKCIHFLPKGIGWVVVQREKVYR